MPRKSKQDGRKPIPSQKPVAQPPLGMTLPDSDFSKYLQEHPEGVYLTSIPEMQKAGLPYAGIASRPENLASNLHLIELGIAAGQGRKRRSAPKTVLRN